MYKEAHLGVPKQGLAKHDYSLYGWRDFSNRWVGTVVIVASVPAACDVYLRLVPAYLTICCM